MNILITGATGFIGEHLINELLRTCQPVNITALVRNQQKAQRLLPIQIAMVTSIETVNFNHIDVVINLAGEPIANKRWSKRQKEKICQSRWQLTQIISDKIASADSPPSTFISGSAIGYYGRQTAAEITEEAHTVHPEFTHTVCETWEALANKVNQITRVCILRTGIVLGKKQGALSKMLPAFNAGLGGRIASGQQYMSWIHINDMVAIIIACIQNNHLSGAINATAPAPVSNEVFSKALAKALHRPCIFPMPQMILKLMFGEMADLLLYGQNVYPKKLVENQFSFQFNEINEALTDLLTNKA